MFYFCLGFSLFILFISICVSSLFILWMLMELITFTFMGCIFFPSEVGWSKPLVTSFLIQSFSSMPLLAILFFIDTCFYKSWVYILLYLFISLKIGMPPFHSWYISVFKDLGWLMVFLMSTCLKFIPCLFVMMFGLGSFFNLIICVSGFWGSLVGFMEFDIKGMIGCSSIVHTSWMLSCSLVSLEMLLFYVFIYFISFYWLVFLFDHLKVSYFWDLDFFNFNEVLFYFGSVLMFSGIPPFSLFFVKFYSSMVLFGLLNLMCLGLLVISSLLMIFVYFRWGYSCFLGSFNLYKFNCFYFVNTPMVSLFLPFALLLGGPSMILSFTYF